MASVTIRNLFKNFGSVKVLQDINLQVADGEFVALVGPSGCGKSTLLRTIAGLEQASSGHIAIDDQQVDGMPPRDRDIAMVFQNYALYPRMTVAQNMGFSLKLRGRSKDDIAAEVQRAAAILDLGELLDRTPRQLSGGQRQRVAMGRAIVRNPKVFLFDEPLSNLDAKLRVQMRAEIRRIQKSLNATVVYVTHDQVEAMTMADRIVVMKGGIIEQQGSPLDLFDRPETAFVAGFIGSPSMNLIPGRISGGGFATRDGVLLPHPPVDWTGDALYGVRPEALEIVESGEGVAGTVELVEPLGSEMLVILSVGKEEVQVLLRRRATLTQGQTLHFRPEQGSVHLFDAASGKRIGP